MGDGDGDDGCCHPWIRSSGWVGFCLEVCVFFLGKGEGV